MAAAAAALTNRNSLAMASFAAVHHHSYPKRGLSSSFLPPLRPRSTPQKPLISPLRPLHISATAHTAHTASPAEPPSQTSSRNIWLSNVSPVWKKPIFSIRDWTLYDVFVTVYLTLTHAVCLLAPFYFTWKALGVFFTMYIVTGMLGITLSYHRNLAHKSFTLPKWLEYTFAYCGVLALQGHPLEWVSSHRCHHQHCDTELDPHSPYAGFWHSHMGWVLDNKAVAEKVGARSNVADLAKQPFYRFLQKTYPLHGILWGCILYAWGGLPFLLWGGPVRVVWVYHITWLVNSACHVWGTQAWNTGDLSRNNWWVGLLAFGEGWHNNHHAFEYSARHGLDWWQFDLTWYFIAALEKVGLATNVKLPSNEHKKRLAFNAS